MKANTVSTFWIFPASNILATTILGTGLFRKVVVTFKRRFDQSPFMTRQRGLCNEMAVSSRGGVNCPLV